jgi:hypothetical protein
MLFLFHINKERALSLIGHAWFLLLGTVSLWLSARAMQSKFRKIILSHFKQHKFFYVCKSSSCECIEHTSIKWTELLVLQPEGSTLLS